MACSSTQRKTPNTQANSINLTNCPMALQKRKHSSCQLQSAVSHLQETDTCLHITPIQRVHKTYSKQDTPLYLGSKQSCHQRISWVSTVAEMVQTQCMQLSWRSASPQYRIPFPYGCSCGEATLAGYFAEVWQSFSGTNSLFPSHGSSIREMVADPICGFSRTHKPSIADLRTSKHEKKNTCAIRAKPTIITVEQSCQNLLIRCFNCHIRDLRGVPQGAFYCAY